MRRNVGQSSVLVWGTKTWRLDFPVNYLNTFSWYESKEGKKSSFSMRLIYLWHQNGVWVLKSAVQGVIFQLHLQWAYLYSCMWAHYPVSSWQALRADVLEANCPNAGLCWPQAGAALAECLICLEQCPIHQKVVGSIPSQGANGRQPIERFSLT